MWEVFKDWIFDIIQFFFNICDDWGLSIIIITLLFRLLLTPLMHSQTKSNYNMQKIQPKLTDLQTRFADDPVRLQEETQKLYAEAKFNPVAGCLPMLLQMPIFIALFQVLRTMDERVGDSSYTFFTLVPDLVMTPSSALSEGFGTFVPYLILLLIFAFMTFLPSFLQTLKNRNNPQRNMTLAMSVVMTVMMIFIGWSSPAGVLLFWGTSSLLGILQQQVSMAITKKKDKAEEEERAAVEVKPVEVDVVRRQKKKRPKKKR